MERQKSAAAGSDVEMSVEMTSSKKTKKTYLNEKKECLQPGISRKDQKRCMANWIMHGGGTNGVGSPPLSEAELAALQVGTPCFSGCDNTLIVDPMTSLQPRPVLVRLDLDKKNATNRGCTFTLPDVVFLFKFTSARS